MSEEVKIRHVEVDGSKKEKCGCETKRYLGGKVVMIGCIKHKEKSKSYHQCGICKKIMLKVELKRHKWTHSN